MSRILLAMMALTCAVWADEIQMKPVKLALYRNGYGLVTLQGNLGQDKRAQMGPLPVPALGSFWLHTPRETVLNRVVASFRDFSCPDAPTVSNLLAANEGKRVHLCYQSGTQQVEQVDGTIVASPRAIQQGVGNLIGGVVEESTEPLQGNVVLLSVERGGTLALPVDNITSLSFEEPAAMPRQVKKRPVVDLELEAPAPGAPVAVSCLSSGISWQPSYRMTLGEAGKGMLEAKATIVNNLMNLDDVELELVSGFPSMENVGQVDPLAMAGAPRLMVNRVAYAKARSAGMMDLASAVEGETVEESEPAGGVKTADLFFYPLPHFSAKSGDVTMKPLFASPIDYRSLYVWEVGDPSGFRESAAGSRRQPPEIWHCIRFVNPLDMPLTDAPVELMEQGRLTGENSLSYTAPGRECTVRMGLAPRLETMKESRILSQKQLDSEGKEESTWGSLSRKSRKGGQIVEKTVEVTLTLRNDSPEAADVEILQRLNGSVLQAGDGQVTSHPVLSRYERFQNPESAIRWNLTLKPQEKKQVVYTYKFYD